MDKVAVSEELHKKLFKITRSHLLKLRKQTVDADEIILNSLLNLIVTGIGNNDMLIKQEFIGHLTKRLLEPEKED